MAETLNIALLITAIGMGLVFAAILLLWGVMALLVRLTSDRAPAAEAASAQAAADAAAGSDLELRRQAAAAAVALALATAKPELSEFPLPETTQLSPWQAVMRSKMLNKRGSVR
jgi:Na+-transporting methylmalonyl-CoA/oxaloacetate decarboxylase gamma subunit